MVRRAPFGSFSSTWQLAIDSSASGARGAVGRAVTSERNDAIAFL
jgi:hypothetical protein